MASPVVYRLLGLAEGLIYTEEPDDTVRLLSQWSPRIETYGGALHVDFSKLSLVQSKELLRDLDRLGWFPSMLIDQDEEQQPYESTTFTALAQAGVDFQAKFEAKYDVAALEIPDFLWHVAPATRRAKIETFGLTPRSQGKLSPHPDRVYLSRTEQAAVRLAGEMARLTRERSYALFRVTAKKTPRFANEQGYQPYRVDPNHPEQSVYSVVNIPPSDVQFVRVLDTSLDSVRGR
jgi:hypothetical protein